MLNFMSFKPYLSARKSYDMYVEEFLSGVGGSYGGDVKILGNTVEYAGEWQEVILAHYPSLAHFADMLADWKYRKINAELRLPILRDTCILMTTELDLEWKV